MLRKFAAAAIAASLIAGPALAQGVLQPKAPTAKIETKAAVTTGVKIKETGTVTHPARKHVTVVRHNHKHARHYAHGKKHYVHVKKVKHAKYVKVKQTRHIVKM